MKFEQIDQRIIDPSVQADSRDNLDCFGEYSKGDAVCTKYCAISIRCAIEHDQNPRVDILDHLLTLDFFPAKMH
ncbi:MAG: hypothetical protein V1793_21770 [Pseudomonadota bacterium]